MQRRHFLLSWRKGANPPRFQSHCGFGGCRGGKAPKTLLYCVFGYANFRHDKTQMHRATNQPLYSDDLSLSYNPAPTRRMAVFDNGNSYRKTIQRQQLNTILQKVIYIQLDTNYGVCNFNAVRHKIVYKH